MIVSDFMNISRPVNMNVEDLYSNNPTVTPDGTVSEPYRYMTYADLQQADPETVRGYVSYVRRTYGVSNSVLAATLGTHRCNVIRILQRAGVPALSQIEGCAIRSHYNRTAWAEFVSGKRRNNSEKIFPENGTNTVIISGLTDGQLLGLLVLLEPHENIKVNYAKGGRRHE